MIALHRLRGEPLLLNPDLIESVEATPDTVLTLVDGRKAIVAETPEQIVELVRQFRASVLARAESLMLEAPRHQTHLSLVDPDRQP